MNMIIDTLKTDLIEWTKAALESKELTVREIANTNYSYVLEITTQKGIYFLKKTPPRLYIETYVIDILNIECNVTNIPEIIAKNAELNCFLMPSCGDMTLRTLFDGRFDKELFYKGVSSYVSLQKASSGYVQKFLDIGVPDWRTHNLNTVYNDFLKDKILLDNWNLTFEEKKKLEHSAVIFPMLCKDIQNLNLPDVLNHSDFHPNAMLLCKKTNEIKIIDLGETTIGNPIFPLASCITNYLDHRYQIRFNKIQYDEIKFKTLMQWDLSKHNFMDLIEIVGPLYYVMTFRELMKKSGYYYPKWHTWIKIAFLNFLNILEKKYI